MPYNHKKSYLDRGWVPTHLRDRYILAIRGGVPEEPRIDDEGRKRCVLCDRPISRLLSSSSLTKRCSSASCKRLDGYLKVRKDWHVEDLIAGLKLDETYSPLHEAFKVKCYVHKISWKRAVAEPWQYVIWDPNPKNRVVWDGSHRRPRRYLKVSMGERLRGADIVFRLDSLGQLKARAKCERLRRPRGVAAKAYYKRIADGVDKPRPHRDAGAWADVRIQFFATELMCQCEPCRVARLLISSADTTAVVRGELRPDLDDGNLLGHVEGDESSVE